MDIHQPRQHGVFPRLQALARRIVLVQFGRSPHGYDLATVNGHRARVEYAPVSVLG